MAIERDTGTGALGPSEGPADMGIDHDAEAVQRALRGSELREQERQVQAQAQDYIPEDLRRPAEGSPVDMPRQMSAAAPLMASANRIRGYGQAAMEASRLAGESRRAGFQVEQDAFTDRSAALQMLQMDEEKVYNTAKAQVAKLEADKQAYSTKKLQELDEAREDAVSSMPRRERLAQQEILNDPTASEYEQKAAQRKLHQATQIDPNRAFRGVGQSLMAGISMALGAYGAARSGGPNYAMQIINRTLDRDIDAQKANFIKKKGEVDEKESVYARMMNKFNDEKVAVLATKQAGLDHTKRLINNVIMTSESDVLKGRAQQSLAEVEQNIVMNNAQLAAKFEGDAASLTSQAIGIRQADQARRAQAAQAGQGLQAVGLELKPGANPSGEDMKKAKGTAESASSIRANLNRLTKLREVYGAEMWSGEKATEMEALARDIMLDYNKIAELGALSDSDREMLEAVVPQNVSGVGGIRGWFQTLGRTAHVTDADVVLDKLHNFGSILDTKVKARLGARGFVPIQQQQRAEVPRFIERQRAQ